VVRWGTKKLLKNEKGMWKVREGEGRKVRERDEKKS
jgi:hypothetical protein